MAKPAYEEKASKRIVPFLAAGLPFAISILLLVQSNHRYGRSITGFVSDNRATTQIVVQILAHVLGFLQTYSVSACQKFSIRLRLFHKPARLEDVGFWFAISNGHIDTSLPKTYLILTILAVVACAVPGALWAGALTPLIVIQQASFNTTISIPAYSQSSSNIWDSEFQMVGYGLWNRVQNCRGSGVITSCPVPALQGLLLSSAGSATPSSGSVRKHSKIDSADWTYLGRSYGVGASVGLVEGSTGQGLAQHLSYTDYGYMTMVDCAYNTSSNYGFKYLESDSGPTGVASYMVYGSLPNSFIDGNGEHTGEAYSVISSSGGYHNLLAWSARAIGGENYLVLATGTGNYTEFNQTQCKITFTASAFNVLANVTSKSITVSPQVLSPNSTGLVPNMTVTTNAVNSLNLLSRMSSSLYTSILGDALTRNLASASGADPSTTTVSESTVLSSLQDSFTAVLDDILGAYGAAQISIAQDTTDVPAHTVGPMTRIGEEVYIISVLSLSVVILLFHVEEAVRTKLWSGLLLFDVFDMKSVIVASSAGGHGIAEQLHNTRASVTGTEEAKDWHGSPDDTGVDNLVVRFRAPSETSGVPAIVAAGARESRYSESLKSILPLAGMRGTNSVVEIMDGGSFLMEDWPDRDLSHRFI